MWDLPLTPASAVSNNTGNMQKNVRLGYTCLCDGKEEFYEFVRGGGHTRGSYYPGVYGLRLRADLFLKYNPIVDQNYAMIMEEKLARLLRSQGFAVWQH